MKTRNSGLTLIEIVVALAILGIMIMGILSMLMSGYRLITRAGSHSMAVFATQASVEEIISQHFPGTNPLTIDMPAGSDLVCPGTLTSRSVPINNVPAAIHFFQPEY